MPSQLKLPAALLAALLLLVSTRPAEAYLDPGTGSMVLQAVIAAIAAAAVALKLYWTRLKSLFGRKRAGAEEEKQPQ